MTTTNHPNMLTTDCAGVIPTNAAERIEQLIGDLEVIDTERHLYNGHAIVIHTLVGDPESDGEDYYGDTAVAWDAELDVPGESVGACLVESADRATWLSLRFPCTIGGAGFARDGQWYADGRHAVRS